MLSMSLHFKHSIYHFIHLFIHLSIHPFLFSSLPFSLLMKIGWSTNEGQQRASESPHSGGPSGLPGQPTDGYARSVVPLQAHVSGQVPRAVARADGREHHERGRHGRHVGQSTPDGVWLVAAQNTVVWHRFRRRSIQRGATISLNIQSTTIPNPTQPNPSPSSSKKRSAVTLAVSWISISRATTSIPYQWFPKRGYISTNLLYKLA